MFDNENTAPNFSDIPSLGDSQGLENYLNNEALAAQGLPPIQEQPSTQGAAQQASTTTPGATTTTSTTTSTTPAGTQPAASGDTITLTRDQLNALLSGKGAAPAAQQPQAQQPQRQQQGAGYSAQDQQFIAKALAQGYSLSQINDFLERQKGPQGRIDPILEQRLANVEAYLKTQEYKQAETAFITKLSDFGNKWGLSEQDLVLFGNEALKNGINIAQGNVNLETVFRAIYPEQYAIRSRRMTPTSSSQIYGGTSIPESSRASASKLEDAYVESFLKGTMPNQYAALNKK